MRFLTGAGSATGDGSGLFSEALAAGALLFGACAVRIQRLSHALKSVEGESLDACVSAAGDAAPRFRSSSGRS